MARKKIIKRLLWTLLTVFVLMNIVAFFHAYKFTHFTTEKATKTKDGKHLSTGEKIKTIFLGVDNPRPTNLINPVRKFETIKLKSNKEIECWSIKIDSSKGTVILFHGFSGAKSLMLDKAEVFLELGYSVFLVDFMGSGGSEGNQTTIGFKEAEEVEACFNYLYKNGERHIYLFGTSMGAVAILKAIKDYKLIPSAIILECPFGTMYQTICARFSTMGVPAFPMAGLLGFWGGVQNGFWAFSHNPAEYAKSVDCPTLLLYGERDEKVSREEIDAIFENLSGKKVIATYPLAGHENYLGKYKQEWSNDIAKFLSSN